MKHQSYKCLTSIYRLRLGMSSCFKPNRRMAKVIDITKDRAPYMPLYSQYPGCGELFGQLPVGKCVIQQHKGTTACGCGMDVCKNEFTACFRVPLKQAIYLLLDLFILLIFTSLLKPGAVRLPVRSEERRVGKEGRRQ